MSLFLIIMGISMLCTLNMNARFNPKVLDELKHDAVVSNPNDNDNNRVRAKKDPLKNNVHEIHSATNVSCKTVHACINIAAIVYATTGVYTRYTVLEVPALFVKGAPPWWQTLCPQSMKGIVNQGSFFIDSGSIVVKTLLYKTIAKWIVACGTHDIVDAAEDTVERGKKVATKMVW